MQFKGLFTLRILFVCVCLVCTPFKSGALRADGWFYFDPVQLEATIRFDGAIRSDSDGNRSVDNNLQVGVDLRQNAYFLDPGIALFLLSIKPGYSWQNTDYNTAEPSPSPVYSEDFNGNYFDYSFEAILLRDMPQPFNFRIGASRLSSINTGSFGSRDKSIYEIWGYTVNWENPAFRMQLKYDQSSLEQNRVSGLQGYLIDRDQLLKTWTINGDSSKTKMFLERRIWDDVSNANQLNTTTDSARLDHKLPWGRNSNLRSSLSYYDRHGFNGYTRFQVSEIAQIQHSETVNSQSTYRFHVVEQNVRSHEHFGEFRISHYLYKNLASSFKAGGTVRKSELVDQTFWHTGLRTNYNKNMFGVGVNAGLGIDYRVTDRDSIGTLEDVIDEAYVVPLDFQVLLNQRFIVAPTIVVTNFDSTVIYTNGLDYSVFGLSDGFIQLRIIPGGQIDAGSTILVSYKTETLPSLHYSTTITDYNLGFNLGWLNFSHFSTSEHNRLLSGFDEGFLTDNRQDTTTVNFYWKMASIDAEVKATRLYRKYGRFEYTTNTFRQLFKGSLSDTSDWNVSFIEIFSESGSLKSDSYNFYFGVNWQPLPSLFITTSVGAWIVDEKEVNVVNPNNRQDKYANFRLFAQWQMRKLRIDLEYEFNQRNIDFQNQDPSKTRYNSLMLNLIRRF